MTLQYILAWWNLIFVVPFALALLYLGLYTLTGITFGDADAHIDGDFDADADADADTAAEGHLQLDADAHAESDCSGDGGHAEPQAHAEVCANADTEAHVHPDAPAGHGPMMTMLQWLGVGRVPVSIVAMVLLLTWGWFGFITNMLMQNRIGPGLTLAAVSMTVAALGSILVTKAVIGLVARWLPTCETTARRRHELLGSVGEAIFAIDESFGMTSIRDTQGDLYQVPCRVGTGEPAVPRGQRVKLVAYNAKHGIFQVIPWGNSESVAANANESSARPT